MPGLERQRVGADRRYRFAGVVVDATAVLLAVDGRPCACSPRVLQALVMLCEAPGRTLGRAELLDRLWPGGQEVADEALSQLIFRARAVLGRYAAHIVTVRGIGFRLDAEVERLSAGADDAPAVLPVADPAAGSGATATDPAGAAEPPAASVSTRPVWHRWRAAVALGLLVAGGLAAMLRPTTPAKDWVDAGFGLDAGHLQAARADSASLLREAFRYEGEGDRARARGLLETVHQADPRTPIPALFLARWAYGGGNGVEGARWLAAARDRLQGVGDPYLIALAASVEAEATDSPQRVIRSAGVLLDLAPGAWQMRLARAHLMNVLGMREAALAELAAIDYGRLGHRKLVMGLADRASMGDPAGARATLQAMPDLPDSTDIAYLRARIAWADKPWQPAAMAALHGQLVHCVERARIEARSDRGQRCGMMLAAVEVAQDQPAVALDTLQRAREGMLEGERWGEYIETGLMLADLHALLGQADAAGAVLREAAGIARGTASDWYVGLLAVQGARLGVAVDLDLDVAVDRDERSVVDDLRAAWQALHAGDVAAARARYDSLAHALDPRAPLYEERRLLAARLGLPVPDSAPVDPPYPPLSRFTARALVARTAGAQAWP